MQNWYRYSTMSFILVVRVILFNMIIFKKNRFSSILIYKERKKIENVFFIINFILYNICYINMRLNQVMVIIHI
jgi:hypothetical protein